LQPFYADVLPLSLQIEVWLPDRRTIDGLLGLYDDDIAIVTSLGLQFAVHPVDLDLEATVVGPDDSVLSVGRAFKSGSLMTMDASRIISDGTWVSDSQNFSEVCC